MRLIISVFHASLTNSILYFYANSIKKASTQLMRSFRLPTTLPPK